MDSVHRNPMTGQRDRFNVGHQDPLDHQDPRESEGPEVLLAQLVHQGHKVRKKLDLFKHIMKVYSSLKFHFVRCINKKNPIFGLRGLRACQNHLVCKLFRIVIVKNNIHLLQIVTLFLLRISGPPGFLRTVDNQYVEGPRGLPGSPGATGREGPTGATGATGPMGNMF